MSQAQHQQQAKPCLAVTPMSTVKTQYLEATVCRHPSTRRWPSEQGLAQMPCAQLKPHKQQHSACEHDMWRAGSPEGTQGKRGTPKTRGTRACLQKIWQDAVTMIHMMMKATMPYQSLATL